jgi:hypothetical protein
MAKTYKLEHFTKGTGAAVVPNDDAALDAPARDKLNTVRLRHEPRKPKSPEPVRTATPLPPGHVRKKATGEIGRVQSVDPKAGTATVLWLRQGRSSTVPLTAVSRR